MTHRPLIFILGPSGAGKSTVGQWVAEDLHFLHIEVDRWPHGDGIDLARIRSEWNEYMSGSIGPLTSALLSRVLQATRSGAILTFPGTLVLPPALIAASREAGITTVVLYGSAAECLDAFLAREEATGRRLSANHWIQNNYESYLRFSLPEYAPWRLPAFEPHGRRSRAEMIEVIEKRLYD
jgi:adenylate kinase family enzyme